MTSILVQGPALRAVPIAPCLHESSRGSLCSLERTGRVHSHLPLTGSYWFRLRISYANRDLVKTPSPDSQLTWRGFGLAQVDLFCVPRDFSFPVVLLPVRGNTWHGCTGTQLAVGPAQVCFKPSEPSRTVQDQGGWGAGPARGPILAHSDLVSWS